MHDKIQSNSLELLNVSEKNCYFDICGSFVELYEKLWKMTKFHFSFVRGSLQLRNNYGSYFYLCPRKSRYVSKRLNF